MHFVPRFCLNTSIKKESMVIRTIRLTTFAMLAVLNALAQNAPLKGQPAASGSAQATVASRDALISRAKSLELNTPYLPPPGDPLVHHTSGFAKNMCSAVFITGLDPDFAAENVGYFTSPYAE